MTAIRRYEYELDFDELETQLAKRARAKEEKEKPPEPTFTRAQLDAAATEARQAGYETGLTEGQAAAHSETMASIESRMSVSLESMAASLRSLADSYSGMFADLERNAISVAHVIARKALPEIAQESALAKIEDLVKFCLTRIVEEPRVVVRVRDEMLDDVQSRLQELGAGVGFNGQMIFLSDDELGPGDCRIEWADGGAETGTDRIWSEIDRVMDLYFQALDSRALYRGPDDAPTEVETAGDAAADPQPTDEIEARGEI